MTRSDLKTIPALRYLGETLTLISLTTGAAPEWQLHLTMAMVPGLIPESDALIALLSRSVSK